MTLTWKRSDPYLTLDSGEKINCWCHVRNEINGRRSGKQVIYSIPDHKPYMPREFPVGNWRISTPIAHPDPSENNGYLYPYFIPTNAWQMVQVWILDSNGAYVKPDGEAEVKDTGYGIHFSTSDTTLGCLRVETEENIRHLVSLVNDALSRGEVCRFCVTD